MKNSNPIPGETVASFFRRNGKLSAGARLGAEKRVQNGWERIQLGYIIRPGDQVRIRSAKGSSSDSAGLVALAKAVALGQKRRS